MDTLYQQYWNLINKLIIIHNLVEKREEIRDYFNLLFTVSLGVQSINFKPRRSTLTKNGVPIEISVSLSQNENGGLRYSGEASDLLESPSIRFHQEKQGVVALLKKANAGQLIPIHEGIIQALFTDDLSPDSSNMLFTLWTGLVHRPKAPPVIRVYYNLKQLGNQAQKRLQYSLDSPSGINPISLYKMTKDLPNWGILQALSIEYIPPDLVQGKVYYRNLKSMNHTNLQHYLCHAGVSEENINVFNAFHEVILGTHQSTYVPRTLLLSPRIDKRGSPSMSIYLSLSPYLRSDKHAVDSILRFLERVGIESSPYQSTLNLIAGHKLSENSMIHHSHLGISLSSRSPRMNIYFNPPYR